MNFSIQSVQDKLRNVAKSAGKDFQLILTRYFQERLLFRLSQSEHQKNFCLKGGVLLYALEREASRPTLDLDLLSLKIRMDMEAPEIKAYSPETVIAEKFEAMIDLAESNSRMKDFYDVYQLLSKHRFDADVLQKAVKQTFENRKTALQRDHPLFQPSFADNPERNQLWERFLQRSKLDESVPFQDAMQVIREILMPQE